MYKVCGLCYNRKILNVSICWQMKKYGSISIIEPGQKHVKVALCCDKKEKGALQVSRVKKLKLVKS